MKTAHGIGERLFTPTWERTQEAEAGIADVQTPLSKLFAKPKSTMSVQFFVYPRLQR
jgi:hypothetical protein